MKMNFKKIFISITLILSFVLPLVSFAQGPASKNVFCSRIDQIITPIQGRMVDREAKIQTRWQEIDANLTKRMADRDALLFNNRNTRDENREAHYSELELRATTDAQKQAVADFKATVEVVRYSRTGPSTVRVWRGWTSMVAPPDMHGSVSHSARMYFGISPW